MRRALLPALLLLATPAFGLEGWVLREKARALVALQREGNGASLAALLAPAAALSAPQTEAWLQDCRARLGGIARVSLPVMATRQYGFFAAYLSETEAVDMLLELDEAGRVLFWSLGEGPRRCALGQPQNH